MGLTAEQKSQFIFEEFISSYGIDVENLSIKYPSGEADCGAKTTKFDSSKERTQQGDGPRRGPSAQAKEKFQQTDETKRLKNEHQQPIKLGANNLKQAIEEVERDHVQKLQVVCAELDDVFENPALEYDDLKNFLEKLLQDESEKTSFVLLSCCTRYLSKQHGTKVVWLLRQYMTEELKRGGAQFYPEREGA